MNAAIVVSPAVLAYRHVSVIIHTCGLLLALAFPWLLIVGGVWRRLQQNLHWVAGDRWTVMAAASGTIYGFAWSLISDGVQLALRLNRQAFGFEDQTWTGWLAERAGATTVLVVLGLIAAPLGYALMVRSPRRWPLWSALLTAVLLISAIIVQPLFANTRPLPSGPLKAQIEQMLGKSGHTEAPVLLRRDSGPCVGGTNLGVFPTTQIVIDDGYLNYPAEQGVEVTAHELSHYVRHDPELGVLVGVLWLSIGPERAPSRNPLNEGGAKWAGCRPDRVAADPDGTFLDYSSLCSRTASVQFGSATDRAPSRPICDGADPRWAGRRGGHAARPPLRPPRPHARSLGADFLLEPPKRLRAGQVYEQLSPLSGHRPLSSSDLARSRLRLPRPKAHASASRKPTFSRDE